MLNSKVGIYLTLLVVATLLSVSRASIENKPVKVTHQNSGPRYDIDEVEKTKLTPEREDGQPQIGRLPFSPMRPPPAGIQSEPHEAADSEHPTVGHINIRRIFLIPISQPSQDDNSPSSSSIWSSSSPAQSKPSEGEGESLFSRPLWPFMAPSRHLFGTDQASRSPPTADESFERPSMAERSQGVETTANREREDSEPHQRPTFDPIQMMIEMMQQALSQAAMTPNGPFSDLNKETSSGKPNSDNKPESSETSSTGSEASEVPKRPSTELDAAPKLAQPDSSNSTKEEIVEIDGKKYLKKTVVNRHVGENIIFMTKRLLFVPLNETSEVPPQSEQPSTTTVKAPANTEKAEGEQAIPSSTTSPLNEEPRKVEEPTTTLASSTPAEVSSSTTTESPSTTSTSTTTTNTNEEETTPKDKTIGGFERFPERIVESRSRT